LERESDLKVLSRIIRKSRDLEPLFYGNITLRFDFKGGNIIGIANVSGLESVDISKLK
jgi:hypothetical protein